MKNLPEAEQKNCRREIFIILTARYTAEDRNVIRSSHRRLFGRLS